MMSARTPIQHLPPELLALSIWPEWNYAIGYLGKRIENRGQGVATAARRLVGRWIALHGSANIGGIPHRRDGRFTRDHVAAVQDMLEVARLNGSKLDEITIRDLIENGRGITQLARLRAVRSPPDARQGWHMPDRFGLEFDDPVILLAPVPCPGALGFWTVPTDVVSLIVRALPSRAPDELRRALGFEGPRLLPGNVHGV